MAFVYKQPVHAQLLKGNHIVLAALGLQFWEYLVREDILAAMENNELDDEQAQALLELPDTMSDLCDTVKEKYTREQETIWQEIEERANTLTAGQQPGQEQSL